MSLKLKIMNTENRIALISERNKDNGRIIAKLQRELRILKARAAAGSETV